MQVTIEKINGTTIKMNFISESDDFEKGLQKAFELKKAEDESLKDFKTKEEYIEKQGSDELYENGLNIILNDLYNEGVASNNIIICGDPSVDVDFSTVGVGKKLVFSITVDAYPEIKLPDYLNVEVDGMPVIVNREDINQFILTKCNEKAQMVSVERELLENDFAIIDFVGYLDDKPFEGGSFENYSLLIGSHTFIDNFEEQLIGMKKGDSRKVTVTFPDNYSAKFLENKTAVFDVLLKDIQVKYVPDFNDVFVKNEGIEGIDTVEQYSEYIKNVLIKEKIKEAQNSFDDKIIEKVVYGSDFVLPQGLVNQSKLRQYKRIEEVAKANNITVDEIFHQYGIADINDYYSRIEENCEYEVRRDLVLIEVAKRENLSVTEEDYEEEIQRLAEETQKTVEVLREEYPFDGFNSYLLTLKAIEFIKRHATVRLLVQTQYK